MSNALEVTMQELAKSLTVMNYDYADFKKDTVKRLNEHDELIKKKIQLAPNEAKNIRDRVKIKVKSICEQNNLEYHKVKSKIFPRVYKAINDKNQVATYRELPSFYFNEIMQDIENLDISVQDIVRGEENVRMSN